MPQARPVTPGPIHQAVTAQLWTSARDWPVLEPAVTRATGRLQVAAVDCNALADAQPQALGVSYWFDANPSGERYRAAVHFAGHRLGQDGAAGPGDSFTATETIEQGLPGC